MGAQGTFPLDPRRLRPFDPLGGPAPVNPVTPSFLPGGQLPPEPIGGPGAIPGAIPPPQAGPAAPPPEPDGMMTQYPGMILPNANRSGHPSPPPATADLIPQGPPPPPMSAPQGQPSPDMPLRPDMGMKQDVSAAPQPPPGSNPVPVMKNPSTLRNIAGTLASVFRPDIGEAIKHPGYGTQVRNYQMQTAAAEAASKLKDEASQAEERHSRAGLLDQQTATMAEEGKMKIIPLNKGRAYYDPKTHQVVGDMSADMAEEVTKRKAIADQNGWTEDTHPGVTQWIAGGKFGSNPPQTKTLETLAVSILTNDKLSPAEKKAKLAEITDMHASMQKSEKPITTFQTDDHGNFTAVSVDPHDIQASGGVKSFGKIGKTKQEQAPGINLTPEAVQFWGQAAGQGVPLPSMGMGASGARAREQIINAAPGAANGNPLAANKADTRANTSSLAAMQKMRDAVVAFEGTANANLDLFLKTARPLADTGSPLMNQPLRSINRNALGSNELAAYDAARQVALTEIAKVVNNPGLSGQLSDAGRKEVLSLIPEKATLGQIYAVAKIVKQDMTNRHNYLDQGIGEIKGRMGGGGGGTPAVGTVKQGFRFKGGDPAQSTNWEKVKP